VKPIRKSIKDVLAFIAPILAPLAMALTLLALAALLRWVIAPQAESLPADYHNEALLSEADQFRSSPTGAWQASTLSTRRVDQALTSSGDVTVIEGDLHVYSASGQVNFESSNLYGVDRRTHLNLAGYGSADRSGLYLFPTHVQRRGYSIWDPLFIGPRQATFVRVDQIDGVPVYVFSFSAAGLDETAGYSYLPDVPENYLAHTDGQGTIWVEPLSGSVVDYADSGLSYFVDPASGARVADFNQWTERYTPETRTAQIKLARAARLRIHLLELWLPGLLALAGIGILVYVTWRSYARRRVTP
jgi:Porin PorA